MLWEEQVPQLQQGCHRQLLEKAHGELSAGRKVYPRRENTFNSMRLTAFDAVKVVIIGQDPYFNEHQRLGPEAHGLCFSVQEGIPAPPSLQNIFKEIRRSIYQDDKEKVFSTDLTRWAQQGVLLLNASLTVIAKSPNSHANIGWHKITDNIIETLSNKREFLVFMLWGAFAQKKAALIDHDNHLVLKTSHPSPLSAHRGFLGSDVFKKCNYYLETRGIEPIQW
ncbi:uracil-DNA glycosylase [Desulfopila inferna]|uniref:uracil-DNA glycosylase n=1 Tax=Desulfopila inferna TaxID=468528 RepID=UPI001964B55C|nr:uracil-DNA glycosylase [Desulfopila inferna]MBM9602774.1 uracil-DNA glycosylase [Desulfopila inferna]